MATQRNPNAQQQQSPNIPQALKLTDYLRPVFQEAAMIREYCLFTSMQQAPSQADHVRERLSFQGTLETELPSTQQPLKVLTGLYVIPSVQSVHLWFGLLSINNERSSTPSPWHAGVFRFIVKFPENYPSSLPTIQLLPVAPSTPSGQQPGQFITLQTHPDISPSTGQFNLRQYYNNTSSSGTQPQPKIYKILRSFRKSFYRTFGDISDPSSFLNPAAAEVAKRDYTEFATNCAFEAVESLKWFKEVDSILIGRFKGDGNLVLLAENSDNGRRDNSNDNDAGKARRRAVGLSFL